jgi:hypothetical protein
MPAAVATTLKYSPVVDVALAGNPINFADAEADGHRVQIEVPASALNGACKWSRAAGSDRPIGNILSTPFSAALETALATSVYSDLDGIPAGLSFTSSAITNEENKSETTKKSNDLIMAYVLFKVYGSTNFNTTNKVYNAADAKEMVDNLTIATAVKDNIDVSGGGRGGPVDQMFRDLLAADPGRFFDLSSGIQVTGLFETNADASGNGTWLITAGDILELKLEFAFTAQVSRRVVRSQQQPLDADGGALSPAEEVVEEVIIESGDKFKVRLQLVATA